MHVPAEERVAGGALAGAAGLGAAGGAGDVARRDRRAGSRALSGDETALVLAVELAVSGKPAVGAALRVVRALVELAAAVAADGERRQIARSSK
jgi:hypothetical protein